MKKLYLTLAVGMLFLFVSPAHADIFVSDNGTQLTVSWSSTGAFYYDLFLEDLTDMSIPKTEGPVFDCSIVVSGLSYHHIYGLTVREYDRDGGTNYKIVGKKYITFALDESSGNCVCVCPDFPKKVFYGLVDPLWWTGIAINNASSESQSVLLTVGTVSELVVVQSNSVSAFVLDSIVEAGGSYPITYETDSPDVGVTVLIGDHDGNIASQN